MSPSWRPGAAVLSIALVTSCQRRPPPGEATTPTAGDDKASHEVAAGGDAGPGPAARTVAGLTLSGSTRAHEVPPEQAGRCAPRDVVVRLGRAGAAPTEVVVEGECLGACTDEEVEAGEAALAEAEADVAAGGSDSQLDYNFTGCDVVSPTLVRIDAIDDLPVALVASQVRGPHDQLQTVYHVVVPAPACGQLYVSGPMAASYVGHWDPAWLHLSGRGGAVAVDGVPPDHTGEPVPLWRGRVDRCPLTELEFPGDLP